jgi:hypothetical protein
MTVGSSGDVVGESKGKVTFVLETDPMRPSIIDSEIDMDVKAKGATMTGKSKAAEKFTYR